MASGITVDDSVVDAWSATKKRTNKFATFRINDEKTKIVVEDNVPGTGDQAADYAAMVELLKVAEQKKQCRYACFDLEVEKDGMKKEHVIFILWAPDTAPATQKMIYASSEGTLTKKLEGKNHGLQANDYDELDYLELCADIIKKSKW